MKTLKFIVDGQIISQDTSGDFGGLVPGTVNYVKAEFSFSPEWIGYTKVASFTSILGREYPPQILHDGVCLIPFEALRKRAFKVRVIGKKGNMKLPTNKVVVRQNGGRK